MDQKASGSATNSTYILTPHYDANGNVTIVDDSAGATSKTTNYQYTATNDFTPQSAGTTRQIDYGYDAYENVTSYTPAASLGKSLSFVYDAADELKKVEDATSLAVIEDNTYDANGNLTAA
ncbi:hypothetical protein PP175_06535 [Aneurinibacillus sp. Ricciae_BoGa-3]|uniref:hypothetical protein n=1 Tax=Aneurinibacillus sp. Ricciae_BoGa-3 TaxID=3022697 RepID=UPI002341A14F|nr:hypothetical protein [Aneurinibacillus sp. Ricciae_BoGa-3]WCK55597.1 hypothetical protein PP175_06535 [Aneurinibacillus sp. Ricciae_BoGa-3]